MKAASPGKRIVILGGGAAGIAAAWRLSDPALRDRIESITVYQRGWRLGGKGASSRGVHGRIEEHGLHVWLGYYDNAFRMIREIYEEVDFEPESPIQTWWDPNRPSKSAFAPASTIGLEERFGGEWHDWVATFGENGLLPGEQDASSNPMDLVSFIERALRLLGDFYLSMEPTDADPRPSLGGSPHPPPSDVDGLVVRALQTAVAAATVLSHVARDGLSELSSRIPAFEVLASALARLNDAFRRVSMRERRSRRLTHLADLIVTTVRGILADGLLTDPEAFASCNDLEYREWMRKHGATEETLDSPLVRGVYDLVFGYREGDPHNGQVAAGLGILLSGKLFFDYKGAIFWKMQAGMGDVVFAPAYQALRNRGVRFEFFHRVDDLVPSEDGRSIQRIDGGVQVGLASDSYEPLVEVKGLPCFPAEPRRDLLRVEGRTPDRFDLDAIWTAWPDVGRFTLEAGRDFDVAILAIPVGMAPYVCSKLIERSPRWRDMVEALDTVATQAVQIWLSADVERLGWSHPGVTMTGFVKPFDTWSSMEHLLPKEDWPRDSSPRTLGYFCNTLPTGEPPPVEDVDYPRREHDRVKAHAIEFLDHHVAHYWPGAVDEKTGRFNWDLLVGADAGQGRDRFDSQFWTANVDPSERYVQSTPGSDRHRLRADESGYENLLLAGDWINTGLNAGCVEAAVMSGLQAANCSIGAALDDRVAGWWPTVPRADG